MKNEISHFLAKFEVVDVKSFSKLKWKNLVRKKITELNTEFLIEWSRRYKKLDYLSLSNEEFGLKEYFLVLDLDHARLRFRERAQCLRTCKVQFPSNWKNIQMMFQCTHCDEIDSGSSHWRTCSGYTFLRKDKDLDDLHQLITYYQEIIKLRDEEES